MRFRTAMAVIVVMSALASVSLSAQWPRHPQAGAPRTPDGQARLDAPTPKTPDGKPDLSGVWETIRTGAGQVITGVDVPPLQRTSQFWNIGAGLNGDLPLQSWAVELRAKRVADNSKDNPDAHCLPIGITQLHNHPQPRKIIHTPSVIVILYEANGGIRQIFTDGRPLPNNDPQPWWYGYSIGKWEGDTLVVETDRFAINSPQGLIWSGGAYITADSKVIERFALLSVDVLHYQFTIEDPSLYTKPWRAEYVLKRIARPVYEYACHEGNHAMNHILLAARLGRQEEKPPAP